MNACRVACNYLEKLGLDYNRMLALSKEYRALEGDIKHLETRFNIDKISDTPEAREVAEEIKKKKERQVEILNELTPK
jgi:hypothetical protein